MEMLQLIHEDGDNVDKYVAMAKDRNTHFRLMGFGHRVYKNFDPRAKIIKKACDTVLAKLGVRDPLLDIAKRLEERALQDDYFIQHKLYPNVGLLQRHHLQGARDPHQYVHRDVRHREIAGMDCQLEGKCSRIRKPRSDVPARSIPAPQYKNYKPIEQRG